VRRSSGSALDYTLLSRDDDVGAAIHHVNDAPGPIDDASQRLAVLIARGDKMHHASSEAQAVG